MMVLLVSTALAQTCNLDRLPEPDSHLSVAWIAPRSRRVTNRSWLTVMPTVDLLAFVEIEEPTVGRLLEFVGQRRGGRKEPRRQYKVVIFDVARDSLCRPVDTSDERVTGVEVCEPKTRHFRHTDGCGFILDRADRRVGPPAFRARWADLVRAGFCVLPAERFLRR